VLSTDALAEATRRFATILDISDLGAAVPSCPSWTVDDLVRHLGGIHSWAAGRVGADTGDGTPAGAGVPQESLRQWYSEQAENLVETLMAAGPDAPAWVFGPVSGPGNVAFWIRRQMHETVVHTWDLLSAQGIDDNLDPALAWDGVAEVAEVFYPRQVALGRTPPLPAALRLEATDLDRPAVTIGDGEQVTLALPAADLLLTLWRRREAPAGPAAALLAGALTP
jgi:uncharacterized protein (TIGR03083 family)